jgi:hypothetical protein
MLASMSKVAQIKELSYNNTWPMDSSRPCQFEVHGKILWDTLYVHVFTPVQEESWKNECSAGYIQLPFL